MRQIIIFHLVPTLLHRIQLRRVRRKVFKIKPIGMLILEISLGGMMRRKMIPQEHDLAAVITMEIGEHENKVFKARRTLEDRETKIEKMTLRCASDETNARVVMPTGSFKKNGRYANRRPSAAAVWPERKAAFVPDGQRQTVFIRFFLMAGQTCFRHSSTACCENFVDLTVGF